MAEVLRIPGGRGLGWGLLNLDQHALVNLDQHADRTSECPNGVPTRGYLPDPLCSVPNTLCEIPQSQEHAVSIKLNEPNGLLNDPP